ncbi:hypothetical protein [Vibrio maritimus]|uniref:hypothetical protein n=1 Tax=Vibrio maritimus TaxID=990268 RepID=UPI001F395519|nr:hypothetical protein [Vibrio maritimus]
MTESTTTFLKIVSSLVSPKTSIKFISIAAVLILSWNNLSLVVEGSKIPEEHKSLMVLFLSLGLGSLMGDAVYSIYRHIYNVTIKRYTSTYEEKQSRKRSEEALKERVNSFKHMYPYLSYETKQLIWDLSEKPKSIYDWGDSDVQFEAILNNGYAYKISSLTDTTGLYGLSPEISDYISSILSEEVESLIRSIESDKRLGYQEVWKTITSKDFVPTIKFEDLKSILNDCYPVLSVQYQYENDDCFSKIIGIDISFGKRFEEILYKMTHGSLYKRSFSVKNSEILHNKAFKADSQRLAFSVQD